MIDPTQTKGEPVSLPEMLDARERRQALQQQLIAAHHLPLISFTLNIAGPVKVFPLAIQTYEEGRAMIQSDCRKHRFPIVDVTEVKEKTGWEAFFSIAANASQLKQMAVFLETHCDLGRLFDIDVIQISGEKLSRAGADTPRRQCLICNRDAFQCGRSRTHDVSELFQRTCEIMDHYFNKKNQQKRNNHQ